MGRKARAGASAPQRVAKVKRSLLAFFATWLSLCSLPWAPPPPRAHTHTLSLSISLSISISISIYVYIYISLSLSLAFALYPWVWVQSSKFVDPSFGKSQCGHSPIGYSTHGSGPSSRVLFYDPLLWHCVAAFFFGIASFCDDMTLWVTDFYAPPNAGRCCLLAVQSQWCIKFMVLRAQDFYTPLALDGA